MGPPGDEELYAPSTASRIYFELFSLPAVNLNFSFARRDLTEETQVRCIFFLGVFVQVFFFQGPSQQLRMRRIFRFCILQQRDIWQMLLCLANAVRVSF